MKWILIGVGAVALLAVLLFLVGLTRPADHVARGRAVYSQTPDAIWATLADFEKWPDWNSNIQKMERREDRDGKQVWTFAGKWGEMPSRIELMEPPRRLVTRILEDAGLGFQGSWEYEIAAQGDGASLTITERGQVDSVLFRAMSIFHDNHATMKQCMIDLAKKFGQETEFQILQ